MSHGGRRAGTFGFVQAEICNLWQIVNRARLKRTRVDVPIGAEPAVTSRGNLTST